MPAAVERQEHVAGLVGIESRALVGDAEQELVGLAFGLDEDGGVAGGSVDGVAEEDLDEVAELVGIAESGLGG